MNIEWMKSLTLKTIHMETNVAGGQNEKKKRNKKQTQRKEMLCWKESVAKQNINVSQNARAYFNEQCQFTLIGQTLAHLCLVHVFHKKQKIKCQFIHILIVLNKNWLRCARAKGQPFHRRINRRGEKRKMIDVTSLLFTGYERMHFTPIACPWTNARQTPKLTILATSSSPMKISWKSILQARFFFSLLWTIGECYPMRNGVHKTLVIKWKASCNEILVSIQWTKKKKKCVFAFFVRSVFFYLSFVVFVKCPLYQKQ